MGAELKRPEPALLSRLREQIRQVQAAPRRYLVTLSTGLPEVDALGVFRLGAVVELTGEVASGRTSLALKVVAAACREKRLSAWVDGPNELYPPAAVPLGVELGRLLIVRPGAPGQLVWSAVQLLRSGVFTCVVLDVTHTGVRLTMADSKKLLDAARAGGALLVLLTSAAAPAQGLVRLAMRTPSPAPAGEPRHLRVLAGPPAEPEGAPVHTLEVAHRGVAQQLEVSRSRFPVAGLVVRARRARGVLAPGLERAELRAHDSLQRPKRSHERDGGGAGRPGEPAVHGLLGNRPGRDSPVQLTRPEDGSGEPALAAALQGVACGQRGRRRSRPRPAGGAAPTT